MGRGIRGGEWVAASAVGTLSAVPQGCGVHTLKQSATGACASGCKAPAVRYQGRLVGWVNEPVTLYTPMWSLVRLMLPSLLRQ